MERKHGHTLEGRVLMLYSAGLVVVPMLELLIEELQDQLPIHIELKDGNELEEVVWAILSSLSDGMITPRSATVVLSEEAGEFFVSSIFKSKPELSWKKGDLLVPKLCRVVSSWSSHEFELWFDDIPFGTVFEIVEYDGSEDVYCRCLQTRRRLVIPVHFLKKALVFGGVTDE
tara:strand:+ start:254 stop:772 length:519 start_codon:yes stop_codon:yes gene_type:complete